MSEQNNEGVYWVSASQLPPLKTKIERLQRRAAKCGSPAIEFIIGESKQREYRVGQSRPYFRTFYKVTVKGEAPKYNGWSIAARILHSHQSGTSVGNVINVVPGVSVPLHYRQAAAVCEHCNKPRLRKDTYLVVNEAGEFKQVGANCIADFLGHQNPEQLTALYELWSNFAETLGAATGEGEDFEDHDEAAFVRGAILLETASTLHLVAAHHRVIGWTSSAQADKDDKIVASICNIRTALWGKGREADELRETLTVTEEDIELTNKALAWAQAIDINTQNEYLYNLRVLASSPTVSHRTLSLTASIISAYRRATEQQLREKHARETTKHVGAVGEKLTVVVTVVGVRTFEGQFGPRHLNTFVDDEGNTLVWWTGSRNFNEGEVIRIKGTVKAHNEYRGRAQTELTRVTELPSEEQQAILASLSPAAQVLLATIAKQSRSHVPAAHDYTCSLCIAPEEYEPAVTELVNRGWADDDGNLTLDDATHRLAVFAKAVNTPAKKKSNRAAKKAVATN